MKKLLVVLALFCIASCTSLTPVEKRAIRDLKLVRISVQRPVANWTPPVNSQKVAALNLLPGIGNFYLASSGVANKKHYLYGALNLITWPVSIIWGVPSAFMEAHRINQKDLVYFYMYNPRGVELLHYNGLELATDGYLYRLYRQNTW